MLVALHLLRARMVGADVSRKALFEILMRRRNLVRLSAGLALMTLIGCVGNVTGGGDNGGLTPEQLAARKAWTEEALPQLQTSCISCHGGAQAGVEFLAGSSDDEIHDKLMAFDPAVIDLDAPSSSRLLTKGVHSGPALTATQASDILDWVRAERDAQPPAADDPGGPVLQTDAFTPAICTAGAPPSATCPTNDVDLTPLGLAGAKLHFVAQALGSGLYVNQLSVIAATDGAYIEHPLFVSWPAAGGDPVPDNIDRFFNVKLDIMPNASEQIGGGTAGFVGFIATDKLTIHFKTVGTYQPTAPDPTSGGGCKDLASFKANAQQMFAAAVGGAAQACASCHTGQNGNATTAMNLTGIGATDDATLQTACNQIKTRVDLTTPDQSGVYLAPDPNNNNHPFRFTAGQLTTFKTNVNTWIQAEKVAP